MKIQCFYNKLWRFSTLKALWVAKLLLVYLIAVPVHAATSNSSTSLKIDNPIQQIITGTVSDASGPLPGVNVQIKGTSTGSVTDFDGNYSISASSGDVLMFSYVGYKTQEVNVGSNTSLNVILEEDMGELDEIVIVGYGTRTKGELTGAVSSLKSEEIENTSSNNLTSSLAGKVPGLIVNDRGAYPGENNTQVFIRGRSTLNNSAPLYVIDGVPSGADTFAFLAPSDIADMSILKDAAAAIYGARAANGVILVTTKRGKQGRAKISINTTQQVQQFTRTPQFMNSWQWATYKNEVDTRYNRQLEYSEEDIENYRAGNDPLLYPNTNWFDLTMKDWASQNRTNVTVSGGSEDVKYFVNGDYLNQGGQYKSGDLNFQQYQIRSNLDVKISERIKLGVDLFGQSGTRKQPGVSRGFIYKHLTVTLPTEVGQYPNGLYGVAAEDGANPAVMSSFQGGFQEQVNTQFRTRFNLDIDLGFVTEGLAFNANTTITRNTMDRKHLTNPWTVYSYNPFTEEYTPQVGFDFNSGNTIAVRDSFSKYSEEYFNLQLNYNRTFDDHTFRGFVAMEQTEWRSRNFNAYKRDLPSTQLPDLFAGGEEGRTATGTSVPRRARQNFFGSLSYNYKRKYLVDFTLRYDGSDLFQEGKRFGTFPGIQAAWVISEESFMDGTNNWLNNLKLRASWAQMGNDRIGAFQYLDTYQLGGLAPMANGQDDVRNRNYYLFGDSSPTIANSFYLTNLANPNVTWEEATNQNVGINFAMFDNRLTGDANYFWGDRSNILVRAIASKAAITGVADAQLPSENIGIVKNWGYELEINWADQVNENFSYSIGGNFTNAKNEVVDIAEADGVPLWRKAEGKPIGSFQSYPTNGLYQNQAEIDADPAAIRNENLPDNTALNNIPGDIRYLDTDGDGEITGNDIVRKNVSNVPEITYGFNASMKYKNFDFSVLFQGQTNVNVAIFFDNSGNRPSYLFDQRWTPDNPGARYPRAFERADPYNARSSENAQFTSDTWLHDASFLRLRELQLGYNIPRDVMKFADLRIFLRGSNVFTWDKLKDLNLDPEMARYENFSQGLYQPLKTWSIGVNINF